MREERKYVAAESVNSDGKEQKVMDEKTKLVNDLIACEATRFTEDDEEWLMNLELNQLDKLKVQESQATNKDDKKKETEEAEGGTPTLNQKKEDENPAANDEQPITVEQYIKDAPPEIGAVLNHAVQQLKNARAELIKALLANERCEFTEEQLNAKTLEELQALSKLANIPVNYVGNQGGPTVDINENPYGAPPMPPVFDLLEKKKSA